MNKSGTMAQKTPTNDREERMLKSIHTLLERGSEDTYSPVIGMWTKVMELPEFKLKPEHLDFVFSHLLPCALHKDESVRNEALKALKTTVPMLQQLDYRENLKYKEFLTKSVSDYMPKLKVEIDKNTDWALIWCLYLTAIQKDMARSIQINAFLSVAEAGFRSSNIEMRTKSFLCWRKLIEIFANEGQLQHTKRVKLITVPLQTTASKNVDLATAKFNCWWYLVNSISTEMCDDPTKCFVHFLNFCFGPLQELPLASYAKNSSAVSPGKLYTEMRLTVIVALIRILGPAAPVVGTLKLERQMDDLTSKLNMSKVFTFCRKEIIHSCAEATVLVYNVNRLSSDKQQALTKNIWENLFALVKQDDKMMKSLILTVEAIKAIVNTCMDPSRKGLRAALPIIFEAVHTAKFNLKKGAQLLTEFALHMVAGLNAAAIKAMDRPAVEKCFQELIVEHYKTIILLDNKINFVTALAKEVMKEKTESSFVVWSLVWSGLIRKVEKVMPIQMEFLRYGLENHFNEMIKEKDLWVFNWDIMGRNQYLNEVAQIFHTASADKAASFNIVEVVTHMFNQANQKYDRHSVPSGIFRLFNSQIERFVSTEFATTFLDSLNKLIMDITVDQFILILTELNDTLKVLKRCSRSTLTSDSITCLRKSLQDKCALLESNGQENVKAFLLLHKDWINIPVVFNNNNNTVTLGSGKKLGAPPKKKEEEFVPIKRDWSFNPKELTEHQIERMKERRDDIPALYNDNSVSQDSRSLQAWAMKTTAAVVPQAESKEPTKTHTTVITSTAAVNATATTASSSSSKANPESSTKTTTTTTTPPLTNGDPSSSSANKFSEPTNAPSVDPMNTSRSGTPTQKKKPRGELGRLLIDTVEGHTGAFNDVKKTRHGRRGSLDTTRTKDNDTRSSPRKASSEQGSSSTGKRSEKVTTPSDKAKRRVTIHGEVKKEKEKTLETVPEAMPKIAEVPKETSAPVVVVKTSPVQSKSIPEKREPKPSTDQQSSTKSASTKPSGPMVSIPFDIAGGDQVAPKEQKKALPVPVPSAPVAVVEKVVVPVSLAETEQMTEKIGLPVISEEATEVPMDLGSESFVEEMNLAVSANNSVNPQRSIVCSPDMEDVDDRESTFLNDTINISPILKEVTKQKEATATTPLVVAKEAAVKVADVAVKAPEILTTPKRSIVPIEPLAGTAAKENNPTAIVTTPRDSFLSKMNGRGAQMLQQTKLFQESTPKEKPREESAISKEDTLQRMLIKTAPPVRSSPSTSILRRKRLEEDMDDTFESPAAKKKKVSFSDPPVSATKEFERDSHNNRPFKSQLNRLLIRKSRTDSASEISNLELNGEASSDSDSDTARPSREGQRMASQDDSKIFEYLQKKYTERGDDDEAPPKLPLSQFRTMTEVLLHTIAANPSAKEEFFQKLMLAQPKDALHWAVKENSSYASLKEVREQTGSTFNNFVINQLQTDDTFAKQMSRDIGVRMDPMKKLRFIRNMATDPMEE